MQQQATNTSSSPSALLCCLSCLDVDAWAQVLLPKLVEQGSARDVALTCTQLRDFCYGTVQHLNLSSATNANSSTVESWAQSIPLHFPNCTSVKLLLRTEASYHATPYMLPALARLPKLDSINLQVEGVLRSLPLSLLLHMLRTQLAGSMRSLGLALRQSYEGAAVVWHELGQFTMLSKLEFDFGKQVPNPVVERDLLPLANLQNLQELSLNCFNPSFLQPLLSPQLACGLTSLTSLCLSGCPMACLRHVGSCAALQVLDVECSVGAEEELGAAEWAAVGQLTGLVELDLFNATILSPTDECNAALSKLTRLQSFGACTCSTDLLSAFTGCTQLTSLKGGWQQGSSGVEGITLPSVLELMVVLGCPPFAALPNLVRVEQAGSLSVAAFANMTQHCTRMEELTVAIDPREFTSLSTDAPSAARIAAIKGMSGLTALTAMQVMLQDGAELAALVGVVVTLLPYRVLRCLGVYLLRDVALPASALMHLAKLQGLHRLGLQLPGALADEVASHAEHFLGALSGIGTVSLVGLDSDSVVESYLAAWNALKAAGLPCPKGLVATQ